MLRTFVLVALAGFLAMLLLAGAYAALGVARPVLDGGAAWATLDVLLYFGATAVLWLVLERIVPRRAT